MDAKSGRGSVLKFVKDDTYFLYAEAEKDFRERVGTYKALSNEAELSMLIIDLEDLSGTVERLFCAGSKMCGDVMEMFLEKFEKFNSYLMVPV